MPATFRLRTVAILEFAQPLPRLSCCFAIGPIIDAVNEIGALYSETAENPLRSDVEPEERASNMQSHVLRALPAAAASILGSVLLAFARLRRGRIAKHAPPISEEETRG